jgi:hypothetical protein
MNGTVGSLIASVVLGVVSFAFAALYLGGGIGDVNIRLGFLLCAYVGMPILAVVIGLYAGWPRFRSAVMRLSPLPRIAIAIGAIVLGYGLGKAFQIWVLFHIDLS